MHIQLSTASLKSALIASLRVADTRSTIPVLSHVHIQCDSQGVTLSVTDLEVSRQERIKYHDPDTSWPTWAAVVPAKDLKSLLPKSAKDLKARPVVALHQPADGLVRISFPGCESEARLRVLPPDEFPKLPFPADDPKKETTAWSQPAVFAGEAWRDLIRKVLPMISKEESRFQLAGARFELNGSARAISTDGHRLMLAEADLKVSGTDAELLVPRSCLHPVLQDHGFKAVGRGKNRRSPDVYVSATDHHVLIESTRAVRYVSRILAGTFPDYDRVICKDEPAVVIHAAAGDVLQAIAGVEHCTGDRARAIRLDIGGEYPVFSARNPDKGEASATLNGATRKVGSALRGKPAKPARTTRGKFAHRIPAEPATPGGTEFGLNPDYLSDFCKLYPADTVLTFRLFDENSQFLALPAAEYDSADVCVIMPIRL